MPSGSGAAHEREDRAPGAGLLLGLQQRAGADRLAGTRLLDQIARTLDPDWTQQVVPWPEYAQDPVGFLKHPLGVRYLTPEQRAICRSVRDRPETTVQAGNSVGKSFVAGGLVLWWVFSVGGLCITTAPTFQLVKDVLWHEIRKLYDENEARLGGTRLETQVKLTEDARAYGYTATKQGEGVSFGGRHAEKMLAVQDEASGIDRAIDDIFDSLLTGAGNRALRIGNPLDKNSAFAEHCKSEGTLVVPVWQHPNVSWAYRQDEEGVHRLREGVDEALPRDEEGVPLDESQWPDGDERLQRSAVPGAVSVQYIEKERQKPGHQPGSIWWQIHMNAEFADDPVESLVPRGWYEAARARYAAEPQRWDEMASGHPWEHGLDVGDGQDPHAKVSRRGPVIYEARRMQTHGDMKDVDRAVKLALWQLDSRWGLVKVDRAGSGSGVVQQLRKQQLPHLKAPEYEEYSTAEETVRAMEVAFGGAAREPGRFTNLKAEAFWNLREAFESGEIAVAIEDAEVNRLLKEELAAIRYEYTAADKVKIEKKDRVRERIGRSPDLADALAFAYYRTGATMEITVGGYGTGDTVPGMGTL